MQLFILIWMNEQELPFVLGSFCADAGMATVFLLDEVLKHNPDFDYHIKSY